jgi:sugar transferase (PEP-CTERM/EpsH1 system associated)
MDFCDVDSDKWLQYSQQTGFPLSLIYRIENKRLFKYEKHINQFFDYSIFVSHAEANLFVRLFPEAKNISVIPNGVDFKYFSPGSVTSQLTTDNGQRIRDNAQPMLLFTGAMDYYANVDGVTWFCNDIFPLLKEEFPKAQLYIVGSNPHAKVKELGKRNGVKVTGFVEDIRPYYQSANVCVIPLRLARGVQNKVLEAMAMGKPVVTTTKAIEGIQAVPEKHVLREDTPQGFCDAVLRLLKDRETRERLGAKGRKFVEERYDWTTNMKKLDSIIKI